MVDTIVSELFQTQALQVCDPDHPFWYTSGLFGPYYINTHFLYGSKEAAENLLEQIDRELARDNRLFFPVSIARQTEQQYENNRIYRHVIDELASLASGLSFDLISGGERRDFFFSYAVAARLQVPHLSIFKDGSRVLSTLKGRPELYPASYQGPVFKGQTFLHIADLVTQASSYTRSWIPAVTALGGQIKDTLVVVDRAQGSRTVLQQQGIKLHALTAIDQKLFEAAQAQGLINAGQAALLESYASDPDQFIQQFLASHPGFLQAEEQRDAKTAERVNRFRWLQSQQS
ncbi:MAG: orotate phosphoribosyltransferase [Oscillospiraceae bacterium]|nr:orotate phosphoribosyltransferase [Oscillospiraceae bacterium]